jgi:hypothetical protein
MMRCDDIRTDIAVGDTDTPEVQLHLEQCAECQAYARLHQRIDAQLIHMLRHEPPPELTLELLAIARDHARPAQRVSRWYDKVMIAVIALVAVMTSVFVAAELIVYFQGPYGFGSYASDIIEFPTTLMAWLTQTVPMLSTVVLTVDAIRTQLVVILLVVLGGLAYTNQRAKRRQL